MSRGEKHARIRRMPLCQRDVQKGWKDSMDSGDTLVPRKCAKRFRKPLKIHQTSQRHRSADMQCSRYLTIHNRMKLDSA